MRQADCSFPDAGNAGWLLVLGRWGFWLSAGSRTLGILAGCE